MRAVAERWTSGKARGKQAAARERKWAAVPGQVVDGDLPLLVLSVGLGGFHGHSTKKQSLKVFFSV